MHKIILASQSPRRKELLSLLDIDFEVCVSSSKEYFDPNLSLEDALLNVAYDKAKCVQDIYKDEIILSADTIVVYEDMVLGKPKDREDAISMLHMLSNNTHRVLSGVCILYKDKKINFYEETKVTFYDLDDTLIQQYVDSKEPMDKAGSYGIQGKGSILVKKIDGDYFNVVGLPIARVYRELQNLW